MAPTTAIMTAQIVILEYDFVIEFAVTAGIVKSERRSTIPIIRIAITMAMAITIDIRYDMNRVSMP